jgi:hypothetical protein
MGSKPKKQSGGSKGGGMGPGQSMAMAGNTGLASITEADANKLQKAIRNVNQATGGGQGSSFRDIGQQIGEIGSKYQRPADVANYVDRMSTISDAIDKGATIFQTPDGIQRVSFTNLGIKDPKTGATILSRQIPELTATAPTLGQAGRDIARAITGFNSFQYTDPTSNIPQMVRTKGLADLVASAAIPGSTVFKVGQDLFSRFFPTQDEEEDEVVSPNNPGGLFVPPGNLVPEEIEIKDLATLLPNQPGGQPVPSIPNAPGGRGDLPPSAPGGIFENLSIGPQPGEEGAPSRLSELQEPNILMIPNQPGGGGGAGRDDTTTTTTDDDTDDTSAQELSIRRNLELAGFTQQQIDSIIDGLGFQMGGLVPPDKGPMSQGVGSLFQER